MFAFRTEFVFRRSGRWFVYGATIALFASNIAGGCNPLVAPTFPQEPGGVSVADKLSAKMPGTDLTARSILPGALGPTGSAFGFLLDDGSQVFCLGSMGTNGQLTIEGFVLYDPTGQLVVQENDYTTGVHWTFATGDAIELFKDGAGTRVRVFLNASTPPSQISATIDASGNVTTNDSETAVYWSENTAYKGSAARMMMPDEANRLKPGGESSKLTCAQVGDAIVSGAQLICDGVSAFGPEKIEKVVDAVCPLIGATLDTAKYAGANPGDTIVERVFGALKTGATVVCEMTRRVAQVAGAVKKINYFDLGCFALSMVDNGLSTATGQSLAQQLCSYFSTDQNIGAVATKSSAVKVFFYDAKDQDGDQIAIRFNSKQLFSGLVLTSGSIINVTLAEGFNHFEFEALNEGTGPPNTAGVTIYGPNNESLGATSYFLKTGQIATIDIVKK